MKRRSAREPKKRPQQARSRGTVDYILQAAAQILNQDGPPRLNTNRIAQQAGVAVASLYQYFPNKEAIVGALLEKALAEELNELTHRTAELRDRSIQEVIEGGIRSVISVHARQPKLVKAILESASRVGGDEAQRQARRQVVELVAETMRQRQGELRSSRSVEIRAFLVVHAVESVVHDAAHERPEYLQDPAFADELIELIDRFLREG